MTLGDYLRRNSISIKEFARMVGVGASTMRSYKNNQYVPSLERAAKIYELTNGQVHEYKGVRLPIETLRLYQKRCNALKNKVEDNAVATGFQRFCRKINRWVPLAASSRQLHKTDGVSKPIKGASGRPLGAAYQLSKEADLSIRHAVARLAPLRIAMLWLFGRAEYCKSKGQWLLDGRPASTCDVVRAANVVLEANGELPIAYPGLDVDLSNNDRFRV